MLAFHIYLWCNSIHIDSSGLKIELRHYGEFQIHSPISCRVYTNVWFKNLEASKHRSSAWLLSYCSGGKQKEGSEQIGGERQIKLPENLTLKVQEVKSGKAEALVSWKFL